MEGKHLLIFCGGKHGLIFYGGKHRFILYGGKHGLILYGVLWERKCGTRGERGDWRRDESSVQPTRATGSEGSESRVRSCKN